MVGLEKILCPEEFEEISLKNEKGLIEFKKKKYPCGKIVPYTVINFCWKAQYDLCEYRKPDYILNNQLL